MACQAGKMGKMGKLGKVGKVGECRGMGLYVCRCFARDKGDEQQRARVCVRSVCVCKYVSYDRDVGSKASWM